MNNPTIAESSRLPAAVPSPELLPRCHLIDGYFEAELGLDKVSGHNGVACLGGEIEGRKLSLTRIWWN